MPWAQPCTAHRRDGKIRGAYAIRGGGVCRMHGGAAPQVRHAAQRGLFEERDRRHRERWARMNPHTRAEIIAGIPPSRTSPATGLCQKSLGKRARGYRGAPPRPRTQPGDGRVLPLVDSFLEADSSNRQFHESRQLHSKAPRSHIVTRRTCSPRRRTGSRSGRRRPPGPRACRPRGTSARRRRASSPGR